MKESVYFYTFNKCASTLFSGYVLKNIDGLKHVDYADEIYNGKLYERLIFEKNGFVYGPVRFTANPVSPVFKLLVEPLSSDEFIRNKIAIFLVRDPRDILVSGYYSFGYTHGYSSVAVIQKEQQKLRESIQNMTINEYVEKAANDLKVNFDTFIKLRNACERNVVLKYEDMLTDWDYFVANLTKYTQIKHAVIEQMYVNSRPRKKEEITSHRRSGIPGDFRNKVDKNSITFLNNLFGPILNSLEYEY